MPARRPVIATFFCCGFSATLTRDFYILLPERLTESIQKRNDDRALTRGFRCRSFITELAGSSAMLPAVFCVRAAPLRTSGIRHGPPLTAVGRLTAEIDERARDQTA